MIRYYMGIDNGLDGGMAIVTEDFELIEYIRMPVIKNKGKREYDIPGIKKFITKYKNENFIMVVLEQAFVIPISGKRACFMNGFCYGVMQGILSGMDISYMIVKPKRWQQDTKDFSKDTKIASIKRVKSLFPDIDLKMRNMKKEHDGVADAINIALYPLFRKR